ncbi:nitroreductase [bacterium]|nr:nitroreductase [bacterium]
MNLIDALANRKSIRSFRPDPVPKETLQEILTAAVNSPSAMNTQPWEMFVVAGDALEKIKKGNVEMLSAGNLPSPDIKFKEKFEHEYKKRQVNLAIQLFQLMGITREDKEKKFEWMQRGFRFFDAPAAIILTYDEILDPAYLAYFDLGCLAHAICLTALKYDLGTCIHSQGNMYPQVIRKHIDIPESKKIFISISIGYPNWDFAANKIVSEREPLEKVTRWVGFE